MSGRKHCRFPNGAFLALAVTHDNKHAIVLLFRRAPRAIPMPTPRPCPRDPVAQSTPGKQLVRDARQSPSFFIKSIQIIFGKKSAFCKYCIKGAHGMSLAEDQPVTSGVIGSARLTRNACQYAATRISTHESAPAKCPVLARHDIRRF